MKCPKCGYLGFAHVERCRNCGYDFSLAPPVSVPEPPMRSNTAHAQPLGPPPSSGGRVKTGWSENVSTESHEDAAAGARFIAVAIDLLILAVVDAVVIYFTIKICGLSLAELGVLPKGPLLAFLLVQ